MIGYYVHHHGRGHLHRALSIANEIDDEVTGLSTLPRPAGWAGDWLQLEPDVGDGPVSDPDAGGRLHWAPTGHAGVSRRAAQLSAWFDAARPAVFVSDVSVEAALLARLHGVPVVSVALPGHRTDAAHELGYGISRSIIAAWPSAADGMLTSTAAAGRLSPVGAISRFPVVADPPDVPGPLGVRDPHVNRRSVLVLSGAGGARDEPFPLERARRQAPEWNWDAVGAGSWVDDPWTRIRDAAVIITHAGQNALAEVAAARRPAIVIPAARPFDEQLATAAVLTTGPWPAIVLPVVPEMGWSDLLARAAALDGQAWDSWNDGGGAGRAARIIESAATA